MPVLLLCCLAAAPALGGDKAAAATQSGSTHMLSGRAEISSGYDQLGNGWSSYGTVVIAPTAPLHRDGWRLRLSGSYGSYGYASRDGSICQQVHDVGQTDPNRTLQRICDDIAGAAPGEADPAIAAELAAYGLEVDGHQLVAVRQHQLTRYQLAAAPGYQASFGALIVKAYLGLGYENYDMTPADPAAALEGGYWGAQGIIETWLPLSPDAWLSADAAYFTGTQSYSATSRLGYRLAPWLALGPELAGFGDEEDASGRAGAFLRLDNAGVETTLSGGVSGSYREDDLGAYGAASVYMRF